MVKFAAMSEVYFCNMLSRAIPRVFFFFSSRRRHTRFDCDWSSDVCSSDLQLRARAKRLRERREHDAREPAQTPVQLPPGCIRALAPRDGPERVARRGGKIGRASCRERV